MIYVGSQCVTPGQSGKQPKELVMLPACSVHVACYAAGCAALLQAFAWANWGL